MNTPSAPLLPNASAPSPITTQAVVIGAGPVGLFQAFQLGLLGVRAHVIDALAHAGGQCAALYPDKPIYDIPGIVHCTGHELTQRLLEQCRPFDVQFHFQQEVQSLRQRDDQHWQLIPSTGQEFVSPTVFMTTGLGAFAPRALKLPLATELAGTHLFYRSPNAEQAQEWVQHACMVVGGGSEAMQCVAELVKALSPNSPTPITWVHRTPDVQATEEEKAQLTLWQQQGRVRLIAAQPVELHTRPHPSTRKPVLHSVTLACADDTQHTLAVHTLVALLGLSPRLGPIEQWGLDLKRKQLFVTPSTCSSQAAGLYAAGDMAHYPGKLKLIVCGFHEATLAAYHAASYLNDGQPVALQYTTTSALLQSRLGVVMPPG